MKTLGAWGYTGFGELGEAGSAGEGEVWAGVWVGQSPGKVGLRNSPRLTPLHPFKTTPWTQASPR